MTLTNETRVKVGERQPILTLHRGTDVWLCSHSGFGSEDVRKLFGTTTLPTPYGISIDPETVHSAISKLNPTALVMLEPDTDRIVISAHSQLRVIPIKGEN
jgi:hypothetical protein